MEEISISQIRVDAALEGVILVQLLPPSLERKTPLRVARYTLPW